VARWELAIALDRQKGVPLYRQIARAITDDLLNPKSALFFLAFLPQFVRPERGHLFFQFFLLGMMVSVIGIVVGSALVFAAGSVATWLREHESFARRQQRIVGIVLIGVALYVAHG
jgi:threonine/homoserine/homoserine lactone efflux protein